MLRVVLLGILVGAATARRSPHADYIEELVRDSGARYSSDAIEDALLDVPSLITKYGYPSEIHRVTTDDCYILELHRIPHGRDQNNDNDSAKKVIFLMHGLFSSSAAYVAMGPGNALGYDLAEAGYDVWMGNARGNYYSMNHTHLNPNGGRRDTAFWEFSWDEIGNYDLPASIDYILEITGQSKLHYVGHSQGGTSLLVLTSLRPEYNDKIISFHGLATAAFFIYNEMEAFRILAPQEAAIESTAFALGFGGVLRNRDFITWFGVNYCIEGSILLDFCDSFVMTDPNFYNSTMTPIFFGHGPVGASLRQVAHYAQGFNSKVFRRYNHIPIKNIEEYGRPTPPHYDLTKIVTPTYLYYSLSDFTANERDIRHLAELLPNVVQHYRVERTTFNHVDFIWGVDVKEQINDVLMNFLREAEEAD